MALKLHCLQHCAGAEALLTAMERVLIAAVNAVGWDANDALNRYEFLYLSTSLPLYLSIYLYICISVYLYICISTAPPAAAELYPILYYTILYS